MIIIANWKMQPPSWSLAKELLSNYYRLLPNNSQLIIAVPYTYLGQSVQYSEELGAKWELAAQNISEHGPGPFTGEVAASMVSGMGAKYVLLGHSERRRWQQEEDIAIAKKFSMAINNHLIPILCVGETEASLSSLQLEKILIAQLEHILKSLNKVSRAIPVWIAYEPVWAIGSGASANLEHIEKAATIIKDICKASNAILQLCYGGSVNQENVNALASLGLSGLLVGGASLQADKLAIIYQQVCG